MHADTQRGKFVWKAGLGLWLFTLGIIILLGIIFYPGLKEMVRVWDEREEYSYGYLIPFIAAFFVWQKKHILEQVEFSGSWAGVAITAAGLALYFLGSLSTITTIIQYALLVVIIGVVLAVMGWQSFRPVFIPVLLLIFMIPLPGFFLNNLSAQLQLLSSQIGVETSRAVGISVYLEGNVIDLGVYKLQVVEACSGLRYLFPLMSLAFICAYIFQGAFWKRATIFLSSIPITVLMNSVRIGIIAVLVEYWGIAQAEGFIHDFEGWIVFMACFGIVLAEIWMLAKIGKQKLSFHEAFNVAFPEPASKDIERRVRRFPVQALFVGGLLVLVTIASLFLTTRTEIRPARTDFSALPMKLDGWVGQRGSIEKIYLDVLKLDDYIVADFSANNKVSVNFYAAYYASQRAGESAHSPRSCIPGGGWLIKQFSQNEVDGVSFGGAPLQVNRLTIQKGAQKILVYYWFQQRGRIITNEYMVKWYLFWDALNHNRTDGAMVRLTTPMLPDEDVAEADKRLTAFVKTISPTLNRYVPD